MKDAAIEVNSLGKLLQLLWKVPPNLDGQHPFRMMLSGFQCFAAIV